MRDIIGANLAQLLVIAAAFGFQVIITLYMQRVLGYGAAASGLGLLPAAAVIGTVSLGWSARIAARFGPRAMLLAGLALIAAALSLLTQIPVHAGYPAHLLQPLLIFGVGGGLTSAFGNAGNIAATSCEAVAPPRQAAGAAQDRVADRCSGDVSCAAGNSGRGP